MVQLNSFYLVDLRNSSLGTITTSFRLVSQVSQKPIFNKLPLRHHWQPGIRTTTKSIRFYGTFPQSNCWVQTNFFKIFQRRQNYAKKNVFSSIVPQQQWVILYAVIKTRLFWTVQLYFPKNNFLQNFDFKNYNVYFFSKVDFNISSKSSP